MIKSSIYEMTGEINGGAAIVDPLPSFSLGGGRKGSVVANELLQPNSNITIALWYPLAPREPTRVLVYTLVRELSYAFALDSTGLRC